MEYHHSAHGPYINATRKPFRGKDEVKFEFESSRLQPPFATKNLLILEERSKSIAEIPHVPVFVVGYHSGIDGTKLRTGASMLIDANESV